MNNCDAHHHCHCLHSVRVLNHHIWLWKFWNLLGLFHVCERNFIIIFKVIFDQAMRPKLLHFTEYRWTWVATLYVQELYQWVLWEKIGLRHNRSSITRRENIVLNKVMMQRHSDTGYYVENPITGKTIRVHKLQTESLK